MNREAINLRGEIVAAAGINESIPEYLNQAHHPWDRTHKDYSQEGHPWRPEQMPHEVPLFEPVEDVGFPGPTTTIEPSAVRSGKALIPPAAPRPKSP
jgi:hypothetical protein